MSFFIATVPRGQKLYHGSPWAAKPVTGREWLAFEPEHAMLFTAAGLLPPPGNLSNSHGTPEHVNPSTTNSGPSQRSPLQLLQHHRTFSNKAPFRMQNPKNGWQTWRRGWLHTYAAQHDLHLIYVDGMSAAKTVNGTLDSQDYILLNETGQHSVMWDLVRADRLCRFAEEEYLGKIDGFLRMEGGFEIMLCNFEKHLETLHIGRAKPDQFPEGDPGHVFAYFQAVASRYHGIGKERVRLNYDTFITAYNYPIHMVWDLGNLPRLFDASFDSLLPLRSDLRKLVMSSNAFDDSRDWQGIVDVIVTKYSPHLKYLTSTLVSSKKISTVVEQLLQPFIDYDHRNESLELFRCRDQFLPSPQFIQPSLAAKAVTAVSQRICSTLLETLLEEDHENKTSMLKGLVEYLDWSTWKECRGCAYDEICFIPIWPMGTISDRDSPSCTNSSELLEKHGYWGLLRPH